MKFAAEFRTALRQIRAYPVESVLIIIALAVGVGALSAVAALYGVNDEIARRLRADLSAREFTILPATSGNLASLQDGRLAAPLRVGQEIDVGFSDEDLMALRELAPSVDYFYIHSFRGFVTLAAAGSTKLNASSLTYAVTEDFTAASGLKVARGSWFSQADFTEQRRVLVIAESQAERLGIEGDPLGQKIPMNRADAGGAPYTIIGVLDAEHEPSSASGLTMVGYTPYVNQGPAFVPGQLYAAVEDPRRIAQATEELQLAVERLWGGEAIVQAPASLWQASAAERNRAILLAGFASVGLLMACLNITNLMLARVRRREKAIAIQRSLGATKADIRRQVLIEAGLLGLLGALLGIILTQVLLSSLIGTAAPALTELLETVSFPPSAILIMLLATIAVTMIIGIAPAARAANATIIPGAAATSDLAPGLPKPLRRNPARLALTALQLIISGAAIVIGLHVLALGGNARPEIEYFSVNAVDANLEHSGRYHLFTQESVTPLLELAPDVTDMTAWDFAFGPGVIVLPEQEYIISSIRLTGPNYLGLVGADVIAGSPLSGRTDGDFAEELLLEQGVAEQLFSTIDNALGQELTIRDVQPSPAHPPRAFRVTGVYSYANHESPFGPPERIAAIANHTGKGNAFMLAATSSEKAEIARAQLLSAARTVHGSTFTVTGIGENRDYDLNFITRDLHDQAQFQKTLNQATYLFTLMAITAIILAAVGVFSLSILNTAERTQEIGIRRALGASSGQVAREITGTATITSAAATTMGIVLAWLISPGLSATLSESMLSGLEIPRHISLAIATLAIIILLSSILGWIVGHRATRANPSTILNEEGI
jgi:ABC-type antimicrobial peptide transport system permease subunit